jgi:hypothetical protein
VAFGPFVNNPMTSCQPSPRANSVYCAGLTRFSFVHEAFTEQDVSEAAQGREEQNRLSSAQITPESTIRLYGVNTPLPRQGVIAYSSNKPRIAGMTVQTLKPNLNRKKK